MKKGREKKKNEKSDETHVKIPLWSLNDRKKIHKTWKNLKEDMKKGRERGGKKKKEKIETHVKIPLWSLNNREKNQQKQGRILEGGRLFSGWPEYIPLH